MQSPYRPTECLQSTAYSGNHLQMDTCKAEKAEEPLHFSIFSWQWSAVETALSVSMTFQEVAAAS